MFEDKNKENTSGLAKLFRRKEKEEEPVSLYEPEMEFVTEEELKKEQEAKQKAEAAGAGSDEKTGADSAGTEETKAGSPRSGFFKKPSSVSGESDGAGSEKNGVKAGFGR